MAVLKLLDLIQGKQVDLRRITIDDFESWAAARKSGAERLMENGIQVANDEQSRAAFKGRLKVQDKRMKADQSYSFVVVRKGSDTVIGGVNLFDVRRGAFETATISFWISPEYEGQGLISEAVRMMLFYAFHNLNLHRIEATCLVQNVRSQTLLKSVGFFGEGIARQAAKVNGAWQDYHVFAMLKSDPIR